MPRADTIPRPQRIIAESHLLLRFRARQLALKTTLLVNVRAAALKGTPSSCWTLFWGSDKTRKQPLGLPSHLAQRKRPSSCRPGFLHINDQCTGMQFKSMERTLFGHLLASSENSALGVKQFFEQYCVFQRFLVG